MSEDVQSDSSLSSIDSDDESVDEILTPNRSSRPSVDTHTSHDVDSTLPPSKRRKIGGTFSAASPAPIQDDEDNLSDISEDTYGSAPGSPSHGEFAMRADQVTSCQWEGCPVGDLGNSDELVKHVQIDHIVPKRAKYTCEWGDCARKGTNHPSGYALKAHMRSHTKEKPFFCALPECDRSFTRSDALAKHMRTVHEPEPSRASTTNANPIDPATGLPKKGPKLRLGNGRKASPSDPLAASKQADKNPHNAGLDPSDPDWDPSPPNDNIHYEPAHHPVTGQPGFMITYPPDIHFDAYESEIPADQLLRLLRRQIHWAQQESEELKGEIEELEVIRKQEWLKKEVLLEGTLVGEWVYANQADLLNDVSDSAKMDMDRDVEFARDLKWSKTPAWETAGNWTKKHHGLSDDALSGERGSEDMDVDTELGRRSQIATNMISQAQERGASRAELDANDDMMAVGALMGLSGAAASS